MFRLFLSDRVFIDGSFHNGGIVVNYDGKIEEVYKDRVEVDKWLNLVSHVEIYDYTGLVIMPGLIDTHVHMSEPGRAELEGFETGTKAAAAGGFTTIVDMPLNSIPPTTTVTNLLEKQKASSGKICVDVGFWGGIVPGNLNDLRSLYEAGVVGFKCFLHPSGDEAFPYVTEPQVELACQQLVGLNALVAFHAEKCDECAVETDDNSEDVYEYNTYLKTRPDSMELNAIEMVTRLAQKFDTIRAHIVHLSAASALPLIKQFRIAHGDRLTVETCHHYLTLNAEDIPRYRVDYKCCPPIRDLQNQADLWEALKIGHINMIVSDHSPNLPDKKLLIKGSPDYGNFVKSWGGIPGVQFGLSLFWTVCESHGLGISDVIRLMCEEPAKMCRFDHRKGKLAKGFDADFCIWDPSAEFTVTPEMIHFRNKANPYMGKRLKGLVHATIVRGQFAYKRTNTETFNFVGSLLIRRRA